MVGHRVVPGDLAAIDQHGQRGGGERLADGAELEDRVGVDGLGFAQPAHAIAAREGHAAVLDDGHGHAGHADRGADLLDARVEARRRVGQRRAGETPGQGRECGRSQHPAHAPLSMLVCRETVSRLRCASRQTPMVSSGAMKTTQDDQRQRAVALRDQLDQAEAVGEEHRTDQDAIAIARRARSDRSRPLRAAYAPAMRSLKAWTLPAPLSSSAEKIISWNRM